MGSHSAEVLIVDDTPENLQVLGTILRGEGHAVRLATGGVHALRSIRARRPDLVLLDLRMPEPDGLEVCRRLRADPVTSDLPVIFLSASQDREDRVAAFAAGGLDFVAKPFHAAEVLARISTHLALARLRRELAVANARLAEQVVAERHQRSDAEALAQERQVRLDLALASAGMGTWSGDPLSKRIHLDDAASALLGQPCNTWDEVVAGFAEADRPAVQHGWECGVREHHAFTCEGWWPDGRSRRRLRIRGSRRSTGDEGMVGLIWDVTEDHEARQRVVQSEKLESLGQLAGSVAHDFNNHLCVITGSIELLRRTLPPDERVIQRLSGMDQAAMCATALVRELLTFARRRDIVQEPFVLAQAIQDLGAIVGSLVGKGCSIEVDATDTAVRVRGCREQLQNAMLNLCVNARDAMPPGSGHLRLAAGLVVVDGERCRITGDALHGVFAGLSVADNGSGIPDGIQERIFEPFFTTKSEGKGTGLGLPTVVGCVKAHGGHLLLRTSSEQGTTFIVLLPALPVEADNA